MRVRGVAHSAADVKRVEEIEACDVLERAKHRLERLREMRATALPIERGKRRRGGWGVGVEAKGQGQNLSHSLSHHLIQLRRVRYYLPRKQHCHDVVLGEVIDFFRPHFAAQKTPHLHGKSCFQNPRRHRDHDQHDDDDHVHVPRRATIPITVVTCTLYCIAVVILGARATYMRRRAGRGQASRRAAQGAKARTKVGWGVVSVAQSTVMVEIVVVVARVCVATREILPKRTLVARGAEGCASGRQPVIDGTDGTDGTDSVGGADVRSVGDDSAVETHVPAPDARCLSLRTWIDLGGARGESEVAFPDVHCREGGVLFVALGAVRTKLALGVPRAHEIAEGACQTRVGAFA